MEGRRAHIGQITNAQTFRSEKHHFEHVVLFMKVILTVILKKQRWRRGNSFGLVTRVGNGRGGIRCSISGMVTRFFPSPNRPNWLWGPPTFCYIRTGTVSPGMHWPECEADLSRHLMLRLGMNGAVPPIPLLYLHGILPFPINQLDYYVRSIRWLAIFYKFRVLY